MEFNLQNYEPVDYRNWILGDPRKQNDPARNGENIKRLDLLREDELRIWNLAVRFQDSRNDPGHGEFVTYQATKLLPYFPDAIREIVVLSAIIHDIGWHGENPEDWKRLVSSLDEKVDSGEMTEKERKGILRGEAKRRPHQNRSLLYGGGIFENSGYFEIYPLEYWQQIADIVGDHDTKKLPTTVSGRVMWDADALWRGSYPGMQLYFPDLSPEKGLARFEKDLLNDPDLNLDEISFKIGKVEIANSMLFKYREDSVKVLEENGYSSELDRVGKFYSFAGS